MKQTVASAANPISGLDRRRFLASLVIATAGALSIRTPAASYSAPASTTAAEWQRVLESMFPHTGIEAALYGVPADALIAAAEKDSNTRQLLEDGWRSLQQAAGGNWATATDEARLRAVSTIVGTPLFTLLRQTTVFTFYGHPMVWQAFGYEGDAWGFGGYLGKGLNTIDWLPDPPAPT